MSLKDFLLSKKRTLNGALAAATVFVGAMSTTQASEKLPPRQPAHPKKINTLSLQQLQQTFFKIDRICFNIVKKELVKREGNKDHLYFDNRGILHTGVGLNINDYDSFRKLDFIAPNGKKLSESQKRAYFAKVKAFQVQQAQKGFNYKASYYTKFFAARPTKESRNRLFIKRIEDSMKSLKRTLGTKDYYNLHIIAQSETIMMHFNMGGNKFTPEKWPKFFNALRKCDYMTMSKECHAKGVSEERNQQIALSFKSLSNTKQFAYGTMYNQRTAQTTRLKQQRKTI